MLPPIIPGSGESKLNFWFLEFWITGALGMPDAQDTNAPIPIIVKDGYVLVRTNEVDLPCLPSDEFAIVGQIAWLK